MAVDFLNNVVAYPVNYVHFNRYYSEQVYEERFDRPVSWLNKKTMIFTYGEVLQMVGHPVQLKLDK